MTAATVLVVDDELRAAEVTAALLRRAGYLVAVASSGQEAVTLASERPPDAMLLDFDMPDMDAPEVLDLLRRGAERLPFPVLILTGARPASGDQVLGLERGATDYLLKGIDRQVLLARLKSALRDWRGGPGLLVRGRLRIDPAARLALLDGKPLQLEPKPFWVLYQLALNDGRAVSREELLRQVWGTSYRGFDHTVSQAVYAARKALAEEGWIEAVPGHGYRFRIRD
jgi:DNA-binding response OmpR family regulator